MTYRILVDHRAQRDIDELYEYLHGFGFEVADRHAKALLASIARNLGTRPRSFTWFRETGPPYRGLLYSLNPRNKLWIIYTVSEEERRVVIVRVWNTARAPGGHGLG